MTRKGLATACACALAVTAVAGGAAGSAQAADQGGCQLDGTAVFSNPLGTTAHDFTYSFGGTLSNCQGTGAGTPATGTISSGQPVTENGVTYSPGYTDKGNGSCSSSTTSGVAVITWADKTVTVVQYATTGVTAAVGLQGTVIPSTTYTGTDAAGNAVTKTFTTTRYLGGASTGALAFEATPTDCAGAGVKSAGIGGLVTLH